MEMVIGKINGEMHELAQKMDELTEGTKRVLKEHSVPEPLHHYQPKF